MAASFPLGQDQSWRVLRGPSPAPYPLAGSRLLTQRLAPVLACIPHGTEGRKDRQAYERTMMLFSFGVKAESPVETPFFAEEISPFLEVFSGWYLSKKIPNH